MSLARKILSGALLAFVLAAIATLAMRGRGGDGPAAAPAPSPAAGLVAFYFHGNKRCASCNEIERLSRDAYAPEIATGAIAFRPVNVDEPANAHFVTDFQLAVRTVVLAEEAGGKIVRWKRLDDCWTRFDEPEKFATYMRESLASFRTAAATP